LITFENGRLATTVVIVLLGIRHSHAVMVMYPKVNPSVGLSFFERSYSNLK